MNESQRFRVAAARPADVPDLHALVRGLAEYERLSELCVSTEADLHRALFTPPAACEALIARLDEESEEAAGFALFFHTYSTFLGRRGLWLEDLFVVPSQRGRGLGRQLLSAVARIATERGCARFEWSVLDWNAPAIRFYESVGARMLSDWRIARVTGADLDRLAGVEK